MIMLSYAGFLRFDELSDLCCTDIQFNSDHIVIHLKKSKTDIYRGGKYVLIAKGNTSACPVTMLQRYMDCAGLL